MAKGTVVASKALKNRRKGFLYFIDKAGNIRESKMKRGGSKGHRTCKTPKATKRKAAPKRRKKTARRKR